MLLIYNSIGSGLPFVAAVKYVSHSGYRHPDAHSSCGNATDMIVCVCVYSVYIYIYMYVCMYIYIDFYCGIKAFYEPVQANNAAGRPVKSF